MSRILVTGAAGFIGSHTVELLLQEGHEVLGVDNFRTGREANLQTFLTHPRFRFLRGDVAEPGELASLSTGFRPDAIIHLAAMVSVPESIAHPAENHRLNFLATTLVADVALAAGARRIVFASSAAVYGTNDALPLSEDATCQPLSPYGEAKLQSEHHLLHAAREHGLTVRCQRYFNVFGPRQDPSSAYSGVISRFHDALTLGRTPTIHGDGEQTRDFIYVGDVARANLLAATMPRVQSGTANICTGHSVSLNQLLTAMAQAAGKTCQPLYGPARAGDIRQSLGSPARAKLELSFQPATSLDAGLATLFAR
ncbi:MAG: NAD-dependent epimerase/dehydratase family protein [Lacunisphaera sp.]|nr:NAD-dependent epimerase/dehydratase family protein [Lacunisphaera sp.]